MKKIMSVLLVFVLFVLVGCATPKNKLPNLKDEDKVDMTAEEKAEFLRTVVELTTDETNKFRLDTFLDLEFAMTSEMEMNFDGISIENDTTVTFDADFDMTNYIEVGDSAEDTYLYSRFNSFELAMLNDVYMSSTFGEHTQTVDTTQTVEFSLTNTFFLARNDYAYYHLNGHASVETKEGNTVVDSDTQTRTFANLKEKTLENRITQEMYLELMSSMLELQEMLIVDVDLEMTEEEKAEALEMLDTYVNIYSSGTTHTVQILITTEKINGLIDQLFEAIEAELAEFGNLESFTTVKASIKSAFKSFNFDFRVVLEGELEGDKKLSRIEMLITGEFSGFTIDLAEFEGAEIPMVLQLTVKLNKLGFILDFGADTPQLPTEAELETFTLVVQPSFGDIFDGMLD